MNQKQTAQSLVAALESLQNPVKAKVLLRFFKTGPGEYGEGDRFWGIAVPEVRQVIRDFRQMSVDQIARTLRHPIHEVRLAALLIMVWQYDHGDAQEREKLYTLYLQHTQHINNWDLVDASAPQIIGAHLFNGGRAAAAVRTKLACSSVIWERRIAIVSTLYDIRRGDGREALRIAELLVHDHHDLIHKAVGWMLREVGKHCSEAAEEAFLRQYAATMPRTMLRYAIERFPPAKRRAYLALKHVN